MNSGCEIRNVDDHRSEDISTKQLKKEELKKFRLEWDSNP